MKTCDEMMNSLLERCEAYRAAQKKKKKTRKERSKEKS